MFNSLPDVDPGLGVLFEKLAGHIGGGIWKTPSTILCLNGVHAKRFDAKPVFYDIFRMTSTLLS